MKLVEIKLYLISYIGKLGFEDTVFIEANSISEAEKLFNENQTVWCKSLEKDCWLKKERKWIILKFPWSGTCAQSAEE